jgi:NRPS condensation-like uncharacterized protein
VFAGSVIRKLHPSEAGFAAYNMFSAVTVDILGELDIDAMSDAFDAVLQAHPVFASHFEQDSEGFYQIVADDLLHSGIWIVDDADGMRSPDVATKLDQSVSLINLQLILREGGVELTLFVHHAIADGHHLAALLEELSTRYTNVLDTGDPGPIVPQPAPLPMEVVLQQRNVKKLPTSGGERFYPFINAYDLPPQKPTFSSAPGPMRSVPVVRCRLTTEETADLIEFSREQGLSLNTLVAAAILITEWQFREIPHIPIPYFYPVDLRYILSPPVGATESSNLCGLGSYVAHISPDTDIVDLAMDITETFRSDLANGLIQQSVLHTGSAIEIQEQTDGLPPIVFCTDISSLPSPTIAGLEVRDFRSQFYYSNPEDRSREVTGGFYGVGIQAGQLVIQQNTELSAEKILEAIRDLLCSLPSDYGWNME